MEKNETLEVIPARYYLAVRLYPKYGCRMKGAIKGTKFAPRIFPKTVMSHGLMANAVNFHAEVSQVFHREVSHL